jgi:hypothetical protein
MSMLLPYICCGFAIVVGLFLSLAVLGVRDCVRGVASRNWSTVARGVALLIAAVASVIVSYRVWIWSVGPSSP